AGRCTPHWRVWKRADPRGPQFDRNVLVSVDPGDFFYHIDFLPEVGTPSGNIDGNTAIVRLGDNGRSDRQQAAFDLVPRKLDTQYLRRAARPQKNPRRGGWLGAEVERGIGQLSALVH